MMDGRVKTLHPKVHGGLLGRRQVDDAVMAKYGINRIDLLVVNLYPFETMSAKEMPLEKLIEYIDIGAGNDPGCCQKLQRCCCRC